MNARTALALLPGRAAPWATALAVLVLAGRSPVAQQSAGASHDEPAFRFRTGVELVNVTATVTDSRGHFVPGLRKEDFLLYEDDRLQTVTHFSNERVPVSLGIALDTSGSMAGEKMEAARNALDRFLYDLLDAADEVFLYRFSNDAVLVQGWTSDRELVARALGTISPRGGTAMYDTVAEAVPLAQIGRNRKKALLLISDGNDTSSGTVVGDLKQLVRETEVLVYAIGIDGRGTPTITSQPPARPPITLPFPFPIPGRRTRVPWPTPPQTGGGTIVTPSSDRVNVAALRELTDDSGGRTEIIRRARDLDPATAGIADELNKQYYLGYTAAAAGDGRWHSIRVEPIRRDYRVRARRGYTATP